MCLGHGSSIVWFSISHVAPKHPPTHTHRTEQGHSQHPGLAARCRGTGQTAAGLQNLALCFVDLEGGSMRLLLSQNRLPRDQPFPMPPSSICLCLRSYRGSTRPVEDQNKDPQGAMGPGSSESISQPRKSPTHKDCLPGNAATTVLTARRCRLGGRAQVSNGLYPTNQCIPYTGPASKSPASVHRSIRHE